MNPFNLIIQYLGNTQNKMFLVEWHLPQSQVRYLKNSGSKKEAVFTIRIGQLKSIRTAIFSKKILNRLSFILFVYVYMLCLEYMGVCICVLTFKYMGVLWRPEVGFGSLIALHLILSRQCPFLESGSNQFIQSNWAACFSDLSPNLNAGITGRLACQTSIYTSAEALKLACQVLPHQASSTVPKSSFSKTESFYVNF